ncbi:MAG: ribosomal-protein-alanine N-acetyltransferase [Gammaproteobacteria bacterium]|nr:MAG: ribosomal-protein-alanine N-acetyltransferase [Gammaproteobacteria bacterium]
MIMPTAEPPSNVRVMVHDDLKQISDIERRSYDFPWSHGVFRDCLLAGYHCIVIERADTVVGYAILSVAAGEAHILNLCVDSAHRHLRYGERLLDEILLRARGAEVNEIFLEVRPSNIAALALYKKKGFHEITQRPAYYQAKGGREDAAVLCKVLNKRD